MALYHCSVAPAQTTPIVRYRSGTVLWREHAQMIIHHQTAVRHSVYLNDDDDEELLHVGISIQVCRLLSTSSTTDGYYISSAEI